LFPNPGDCYTVVNVIKISCVLNNLESYKYTTMYTLCSPAMVNISYKATTTFLTVLKKNVFINNYGLRQYCMAGIVAQVESVMPWVQTCQKKDNIVMIIVKYMENTRKVKKMKKIEWSSLTYIASKC
jgi:hypothetical protein